MKLKEHWENIYDKKTQKEFSWYQEFPETSIFLLKKYCPEKKCAVIDIGGGDTYAAKFLWETGFRDITVLDISEKAIQRAKENFGNNASEIKWFVSDVLEFNPERKFKLWHDRAAFHFLTQGGQAEHYAKIAADNIESGGHLIISTFSENGPRKCSGIEIKQYNEHSLEKVFSEYFTKLECLFENHKTPFNTEQNFIFCVFERK
ncbi:MAG: class I SAM-dependent methyltransferase [Bacteroidia bacterium]|nr:class I SAM-dependent methyltransferase [Bacteroidia bacterium]